MSKDNRIREITEDDKFIIPEYMLNMSVEDLEAEAERAMQEYKKHPMKREDLKSNIKFLI